MNDHNVSNFDKQKRLIIAAIWFDAILLNAQPEM